MCINSELGHVVWHDLLTHDVDQAKRFYAELLGWEYQIEQASDFDWKPGEADYPLIIAKGEAHGGFVETGQDNAPHWLAYIRVEDIDAVTVKAQRLGATIDREPFDVEGVGRSAVIQDLEGAFICPYVPTHNFPAPSGTFLWDELNVNNIESAKLFYRDLFDWKSHEGNLTQRGKDTTFKCADDTNTAGVIKRRFGIPNSATWVTYLATDDINTTLKKAKTLGAQVYREGNDRLHNRQIAILADPTGAVFGLLASSESHKP